MASKSVKPTIPTWFCPGTGPLGRFINGTGIMRSNSKNEIQSLRVEIGAKEGPFRPFTATGKVIIQTLLDRGATLTYYKEETPEALAKEADTRKKWFAGEPTAHLKMSPNKTYKVYTTPKWRDVRLMTIE